MTIKMAIINFVLTKLKNGVKSVIKSKIFAFRSYLKFNKKNFQSRLARQFF